MKDLEQIFRHIFTGACVGLYGERRSGKTLTLEMIQAIINGDIADYENDLIDGTLRATLPRWKKQFVSYRAVYVSLQATRTEEELVGRFLDESQRIGIGTDRKNKRV